MDTSQQALRQFSTDERIKKIRRDITSLANAIQEPRTTTLAQTHMDSLMIHLIRLADMHGLEIYTGKIDGKTVMSESRQP